MTPAVAIASAVRMYGAAVVDERTAVTELSFPTMYAAASWAVWAEVSGRVSLVSQPAGSLFADPVIVGFEL
jgi:hypothetical protein